jgi:AcrR family transcriptional regulator
MEVKKTQAQRSAATQAALLEAARPLFAEHGYAAISTDQIARAAGVTRGALYHQFSGKEELFAAVVEQIEAEIAARIGAHIAAAAPTDTEALIGANIDAFLAACAEPEVHRIALIEAPAALGWERWRAICFRHGVGNAEKVLQGLIDAGLIAEQPVRPLAHVVAGAIDEAALYASRAEDRDVATKEAREAVLALVTGLLTR